MSKFIYTEEMVEYLRVVAVGKHRDDITKAFNERFGTSKAVSAIASAMSARGIVSGYVHSNPVWIFTLEQIDWIKEQYALRSVSLFYPDFVLKFGNDRSPRQIEFFIKNQGIVSGRDTTIKPGAIPHNKGRPFKAGGRSAETQFKKGRRGHNHRNVGDEVITKDGYINVKIAEPSVWRQKHVIAWEQHNGPLKKGERVSFRDNNRTNVDIDNLMLVTSGEMGVMNKQGLSKVEPELKDAALMLAQLIIKRGKL